MAKFIDQAALKGVILQAGITTTIPTNTRVAVRITGVPENNIKLLASVFIYQNFSASEPLDFFAFELGLVRQRRSIFYTPRQLTNNDIFRVIPLYDFTKIEVWAF